MLVSLFHIGYRVDLIFPLRLRSAVVEKRRRLSDLLAIDQD